MMPNLQELNEYFVAVRKRANVNAEFAEQLKTDPKKALKENGFDVATETDVTIHSNTADTLYIVFPQGSETMSERDLQGISGGGATTGCASSLGTFPSCLSSAGTASSSKQEPSAAPRLLAVAERELAIVERINAIPTAPPA